MQAIMTRRGFLERSLGASVTLAGLGLAAPRSVQAIPPIQRAGSARLRLSMAAYSFRDYFRNNGPRQRTDAVSARRIDLFQFIDYCADHGCQGTELTSYYFPTPVTDEVLFQLKRHAFLRGLAISGTSVGNNFAFPPGDQRDQQIASVKTGIDRAQLLGAPYLRVFAGGSRAVSKAEAKKLAISALQESSDYAAAKGVMLGLENDGGMVAEADDLLEIVKAVQSPWFGVNLDIGNFQTDNPYHDLARCAPYAINVHMKAEIQRRGQPREPADFGRLIKILRDVNYQGYLALEYESAEDPWQAVPRVLGQLKELL
jgi:sugar phosphate isomerase/epimerase